MLTRRHVLRGFAALGALAAAPAAAAQLPAGRGKLLASIRPTDLVGCYLLVVDHEGCPLGLLWRLDVYEHGLVGWRFAGVYAGADRYLTPIGETIDLDGVLTRWGGDVLPVTDRMIRERSADGGLSYEIVLRQLDERELGWFTLHDDAGGMPDLEMLARGCPVVDVLRRHPMYRPYRGLSTFA